MAPLRTQDHELFTTTELALIQSSSSSAIKSLSLARIKSYVTRARRYGDKYRDLARQQHRTKKRDSGKGQASRFRIFEPNEKPIYSRKRWPVLKSARHSLKNRKKENLPRKTP
jgi:hypothetical protein